MSPDDAQRDPFVNVPEDENKGFDRRDEERPEVKHPHGELDRMPEEEADLDKPHVGDQHGPVIGKRGSIDPDRGDRAEDPVVGFKNPPVRPREVQ